jgi:hypothetical protein
MKKQTISIFAMVLFSVILSQNASAISEGGAIFLMIRPGARPSGMGSAFCAIADDATATYFNPAGLAYLKRSSYLIGYDEVRDWNKLLGSFRAAQKYRSLTVDDIIDPESAVIMFGESALICRQDVVNWPKLLTVFEDSGAAGHRNLSFVTENGLESLLASRRPGDSLSPAQKDSVIFALNKALQNKKLYLTANLSNLNLPDYAGKIITDNRLLPDHNEILPGNIINPKDLVLKLKERKDPVSRYIYGKTPPALKNILNKKGGNLPEDSLRSVLASILNTARLQNDLYSEQRFKDFAISADWSKTISSNPANDLLYKCNLYLLLLAYPGAIDIANEKLPQSEILSLNRAIIESSTDGAINNIAGRKLDDPLSIYLKAKLSELLSQVFMQFDGESPLADPEKRIFADGFNDLLANDTEIFKKALADKGRLSGPVRELVRNYGELDFITANVIAVFAAYPNLASKGEMPGDSYMYLQSLMSPDAYNEIAKFNAGQQLTNESRQKILDNINLLLSKRDLYQSNYWEKKVIATEAADLLAEGVENLDGLHLQKLNRLLIQSLYVYEIEKIEREKHYATLMHSPWLSEIWSDVGDMYYEYIAYAQPVKDWGVLGGNIIFISEGTSQHTGELNQDYGEFSSYEFSPCLSYGNELFNGLAGGVNLKLIHSHLAPFGAPGSQGKGVATSWALDFALLYKGPFKGLSFGTNLQNIGPSLTYIDAEEADPLSRNVRVGTAYKMLNGRYVNMTMAYDITKMLVITDRPWKDELKEAVHHIGLEYRYTGAAALGLRSGYVIDEVGQIKGPTYGFGVGYRNIQFDFGMEPGGELQKYNKKFSLSVEL